MGKKEKKDNKPAPLDIFDPLNFESHQAYTSVILLDSAEEDVLGRSCEAIYKFADKCEDNKRTLLEMGVLEPLLRLILHEDRVVRKNSTAALGVLTHSPDIRRELRKMEVAVPNIVALLSPLEESIVQEFAALALSQIALEYTSKTVILENRGMEPLVRGLTSSDPDVQKNCIETIALLLMDFKGRVAFRECEGFPPILTLLQSEYAIIQQLAILVLDRSAQESDCRALLRELDTVPKLVEIVGKTEWHDLHVPAVQVLSHLLEDRATLEQIKEASGIKKLVAFITDQPPPEEESKKDKKAASKSGKKSAKGENKKKEEEKDEREGENIIPTLPDVKICASHAIARSARSGENRRLLHEMEAEKMLIHLLSHENPDVQAAAAFALSVMAEYVLSRDSIREWEGIPPLVKMLSSEYPNVKEATTCVLANLTVSNITNCLELESGTAIDHLVTLLADPCLAAAANAASVLMNMSSDEGLRTNIQSKGVVEALITPLTLGDVDVQSRVTLALAAFVCDTESRGELLACRGLEILVPLMESGNDTLRRNACWAIQTCAVEEPIATEICHLRGMEILQSIQNSSTRKNVFAECALNKLLNSSLSAKFALTGYLSTCNLIHDEFFDAGQLRPDKPFVKLQDYLQEELMDRRAIIVINGKMPAYRSGSTVNIEDSRNDTPKNMSGKLSRSAGRESKNKSRAMREKEEKVREEELTKEQKDLIDETKMMKNCPFDMAFVKYIEEVTEKIEPLSTTRDQVFHLAQFVSEKMGGPIEPSALTQFSWILPLSNIMYDAKSNVVPIGKIRCGIHIHRALLFKALADRIAVACTLVRGDYNRAWNEIMLPAETDNDEKPEYPNVTYIVDLVHEPGRLMRLHSPDAISYMKI